MKSKNINDYVYVKLTAFGESIIEKEKNEILSELPKTHKYQGRLTNEKGTRFQFYELMNMFGPYLYNGATKIPFENNEIYFT